MFEEVHLQQLSIGVGAGQIPEILLAYVCQGV